MALIEDAPEIIAARGRETESARLRRLMDSYWQYQLDEQPELATYTGDPGLTQALRKRTLDWVLEAQQLGAGEIVLNCMGSDGVRGGYDIEQLQAVRAICRVPLVASGGAGAPAHFAAAFAEADVDAALAASVFHSGAVRIPELKTFLRAQGFEVRDVA